MQISIPVPEDADTPRFRTNIGTVHYAPETSSIVWKIKQFGGGKEFLMRAELGLPSVRGDDEKGGGMMGGFGGSMGGVGGGKGKRPISVKFEIPYFTTSGIQVRYLKIIEPKVCGVLALGLRSDVLIRHAASISVVAMGTVYYPVGRHCGAVAGCELVDFETVADDRNTNDDMKDSSLTVTTTRAEETFWCLFKSNLLPGFVSLRITNTGAELQGFLSLRPLLLECFESCLNVSYLMSLLFIIHSPARVHDHVPSGSHITPPRIPPPHPRVPGGCQSGQLLPGPWTSRLVSKLTICRLYLKRFRFISQSGIGEREA